MIEYFWWTGRGGRLWRLSLEGHQRRDPLESPGNATTETPTALPGLSGSRCRARRGHEEVPADFWQAGPQQADMGQLGAVGHRHSHVQDPGMGIAPVTR